LTVSYRFVIERLNGPEQTPEAKENARKIAQSLYDAFAKQFGK
jgi:hypothetical protein